MLCDKQLRLSGVSITSARGPIYTNPEQGRFVRERKGGRKPRFGGGIYQQECFTNFRGFSAACFLAYLPYLCLIEAAQ